MKQSLYEVGDRHLTKSPQLGLLGFDSDGRL